MQYGESQSQGKLEENKSTAINLTRTAGEMKYCVFFFLLQGIDSCGQQHACAVCTARAAGTRSASCFSILTARDVDVRCF